MSTLRQELQQRLGSWRDHLCQSWLDVLGTTELAFGQIPANEMFDENYPVFPDFGHDFRHVFRAFEQLAPADVKAVLIGEDPYPKVRQATGRSFEQGDLDYWIPLAGSNERHVACAPSLQSIVQQLATFRTGCRAYSKSKGGWDALKTDLGSNALLSDCIPAPRAVFDQWQSHGVLMLNTALTFTKGSQQSSHAKLWRPFVRAVTSHFACRREATVFLCFGNKAWKILGTHTREVLSLRNLVVRRAHPRPKHLFLPGCNVFDDANAKLRAAGRSGVDF